MGRRSNRAKGNAKPAASRKAPKSADARVRDLEKRLAAAADQLQTRDRELAEAQEQLRAASEILRVISSSPTDYQPVFDTIVRRAGVVCGAVDAVLWTIEGDELVVRAHHGPIPATIGARQPTQGSVAGAAAREARIVHVEDLTRADEFPVGRDLARRLGWRTTLSVPLLRGGVAIGAILVRRSEVQPFADRQIALLQTFADEAVIALENVRLFNETNESLERQTATAEVLRIISSSMTDVQPVFDAIVRSAVRLCGASTGGVYRFDGELIHSVAHDGFSPEQLEQWRKTWPRPASSNSSPTCVAVRTREVIRIGDIESTTSVPLTPEVRANLRSRGLHSILAVPMISRDVVLGAIGLGHPRVGGFSDSHVELLRTFADQAVIAIENVRLFNETKEALDRQTATAEILRVIAGSPTDLQPVLNAVAESAARVCAAEDAVVMRVEGDTVRPVAYFGTIPPSRNFVDGRRLSPRYIAGRAILDRRTIHVANLAEVMEDYSEANREFPTILAAPLIREGAAVGAIVMRRREVRPFTDKQIALLQTFADQAVIAIENVRLFTELEARNRDLTAALDQQTATAEILRVISSSVMDVQPVFDAIVRSAVRLCGASHGGVYRFDGELIHSVAHDGYPREQLEQWRKTWPRPASANTSAVCQAILTREIVRIGDIDATGRMQLTAETRANLRARGSRSILAVPMMSHDAVVGAIALSHPGVDAFSDAYVELLRTFADQAVIAIENVRLFTELQDKNHALGAAHAQVTEALEQQTATSDILRVISRSQTDVQPVFEAILSSAVRLLGTYSGALTRVVDNQIELVAFTRTDDTGAAVVRGGYPQSLQSEFAHAQAIRARAPLNFADAQTDPRLPEAERDRARVRGFRSRVLVPLLRHDEAIGALSVARREAGGFTPDEIALLETFADQAVIAIENARLLSELQTRTGELSRSVEQLTALGEVGRAVSSTLDLETVLTTIVTRAVEMSGFDSGVVFEYDGATEEFVHRVGTEAGGALAEARRSTRIRKGEGAVGQTALTLEPAQVADITVPGAYESRLRENLIASGIRAVLAVPMVREGELIGCLVVSRHRPGEFAADTIELLRTFATQSALAIQNARLFREIEIKSRELEAASRHKSEFLANMSHELRTPLNAIIGFSEVLSERMFGELNDKQDEYLKDIHASGQHLLSLINDILDLSKIEAGKMDLELSAFDLPTTVDNALMLVRERAGRRGIELRAAVDARLGLIEADERKVRQVLLNLLSNAIKFTPEGGRIEVGAVPRDGMVEVSVTDTGVGIAPEDQEAVFEEFRQVGTAEKRVGGTGLGLALSRKFIELHGGAIWVKSQVGAGSTFAFTVPARSPSLGG